MSDEPSGLAGRTPDAALTALRTLGWLSVAGLVIGLLVPPTGLGGRFSLCIFHTLTGLPCPGCGLTRSVSCVLHGHLHWAWHYNPFGIPVAAAMVLGTIVRLLPSRAMDALAARLRPRGRLLAIISIAFAVVLVLHGFVRMYHVSRGDAGLAWWRTGGKPPFVE